MKRTTPSLVRRVGVLLTTVLAAGVAACSATEEETGPSLHLAPRVAITSVEGDTLSELLAAIYARAMENSGVRVVRKDPVVMDRSTYAQAIIDGQFQMIPDFSGELLDFLAAANPTTPSTSPDTTEAITATTRAPITIPTVPDSTVPDSTVPDSSIASTSSEPATSAPDTTAPDTTATSAPESSDVSSSSTPTTLAPPVDFAVSSQIVSINSTIDPSLVAYTATFAEQRTVIACTQAYLERQAAYQLITLTDLASLAPSTRFAAPAAFIAADDTDGGDADGADGGLGALLRVYAPEFAETITVEADAIATAVADDSADCFAVDSLDPVITAEKLTIIVDDQYMVPMNVAIALLSAASAGPEVASALDRVAGSLSTQKLNQLLREVEVKGTEIDVVANAFVDNLGG